MSSPPAIGIDLGTTYSCVAYFKDKHEVIVFENDCGKFTTPSVVAFDKDEVLVGNSAKEQASLNPQNTIYDTKRLIGRSFDDPVVQNDARNWPFTIVGVENKPVVEVEFKEAKHQFHAEQILAMILTRLKEIAEKKLNVENIVDVVITVPAAFNDGQRQATIDAGTIAGLNVLRIINEPTAAAIAYGLERQIGPEKHILVYDLGGGTFDVSILQVDNDTFTVKCSLGDPHLGGQDFDSKLLDALAEEIRRETGRDPRNIPKAKSRLRLECENAKKDLSGSRTTNIVIDSLFTDFDYEKIVSRSYFEELCNGLFQKSIRIVKQCLMKANLSPSQIDEVVLVGGSSRIPKVQSLMSNAFEGKALKFSINPDHAIAYGAAIQAAVLKDSPYPLILIDIANNSLGVETVGGIMSKVIEKHTAIPCRNSQEYSTTEDNQTSILVQVFEGENERTDKNRKLGEFTLPEIPPRPAGEPTIKVSFSVNENGILTVEAEETTEGIWRGVTIVDERGRLSVTEIEKFKTTNVMCLKK